MSIKSHKAIYVGMLIIILLTSLLFIYTKFNPENSEWFPKCIFLQLTGFKCPGCGSQRAIHNLLNLNIISAIKHNALLVLSLPLLTLYGLDYITGFRHHKLHNRLHSYKTVTAISTIIVIWWIARNIFGL